MQSRHPAGHFGVCTFNYEHQRIVNFHDCMLVLALSAALLMVNAYLSRYAMLEQGSHCQPSEIVFMYVLKITPLPN